MRFLTIFSSPLPRILTRTRTLTFTFTLTAVLATLTQTHAQTQPPNLHIPARCIQTLIPKKANTVAQLLTDLNGAQFLVYKLPEAPGVTLTVSRQWVPFESLARQIANTGTGDGDNEAPSLEQEETLKQNLRWHGALERLRGRQVRVLNLHFDEPHSYIQRHSLRIGRESDYPVRLNFAEDFAQRERLLRTVISSFAGYFSVIAYSWTGDALSWRDLEESATVGLAQSGVRRPVAGHTVVAEYLRRRRWTEEVFSDLNYPEQVDTHFGLHVRYPIGDLDRMGYGAASLFFRGPR